MGRRAAGAVFAIFALAALGLLGGCGGSSSSGNGVASKSPEQILAASKAAADGASSAHVSGSIVTGGGSIGLDLSLSSTGGRGQLSLGGLGFELIETGATVYIKGSAALYRHIAGAEAAKLLQGRWLKAPSSAPEFASIASLTNLHGLIDATLADHGTLTKLATTTVDGQKVVGLRDVANGETIYVATVGKPYPVQVTRTGSGGGTVHFSSWNAPVTIAAPANAIDLAQLRTGH
jgi:hypothetical protein